MNEIDFFRRFYEILTIFPWTWWEMNKVVYDMVLKSIKTNYQKVKVKFMIFKVLTIRPWLKTNEVGGSYKNQLGNSLIKTNLQKVNVKLNLSQSPI